MATTITWDNFDKAFWVSSTNMRNLMKAAIDTSSDVGNLQSIIDGLGPVIRDINDRLNDLEAALGPGGAGGGIQGIWTEISDIWGSIADLARLVRSLQDTCDDLDSRITSLGG